MPRAPPPDSAKAILGGAPGIGAGASAALADIPPPKTASANPVVRTRWAMRKQIVDMVESITSPIIYTLSSKAAAAISTEEQHTSVVVRTNKVAVPAKRDGLGLDVGTEGAAVEVFGRNPQNDVLESCC